jgi:hypothetical protein
MVIHKSQRIELPAKESAAIVCMFGNPSLSRLVFGMWCRYSCTVVSYLIIVTVNKNRFFVFDIVNYCFPHLVKFFRSRLTCTWTGTCTTTPLPRSLWPGLSSQEYKHQPTNHQSSQKQPNNPPIPGLF